MACCIYILIFPKSHYFKLYQWLCVFIIAQSDTGVHINQITGELSTQGYSAGDIRNAINDLSNEGHIYSTIDEDHYQYAE